MPARLDRLLTRLWLTLGGLAATAGCLYLGSVIGVRRWPYEVRETIVLTGTVAPGQPFRMGRRIDYQDDCELLYDRRLQSRAPGADGALRRVVLPDIDFKTPPWDLDGRLWTVAVEIPADFPCGAAAIIDSPSAACNWFQRLFWRQRRPDAVTPFTVACPAP